jgi:hypothetical protein
MSDWQSLRNNPISNFVLGSGTPQQPGVGGVRDLSHPLQRDPISGMYFDPQTGTSYYDALGTQVVTDPNVAQQVATNFQRANAFLGQIVPLQQQQQNVFANQGKLAGQLQDIISGRAPSLTQEQLTNSLNQIAQQQQSQAAGTSGPGQLLAQLAAMRNTGQASIGANNTAATARIQEQRSAQDALAQLLNSQASGLGSAINTDVGAGENFANLAAGGQASQQGLNAQANAANAKSSENLGYAALGGLGNLVLPSGSQS